MRIGTKLGLLFAGTIIVFILLGVTLLVQMKVMSNGYDALLASPVHDIDSARVVQVNFKKQVQEWKDTLLRGYNPKDLATYSKQFHEREAMVRGGAVALAGTVQDGKAHKLLTQFIAADDALSVKYQHAYQVFVAGGADFKSADALVRGQDRAPTDLFDKVVARLGAQVQSTVAAQQLSAHRIQALALGISGSILLLLGVLGSLTVRSIVKRLAELHAISNKLANADVEGLSIDISGKDEIGEFARTLHLFRDSVMEKLRLESELIHNIAAKDAAETSNQIKSKFLANMSHELRTPLNAILGFSEMIGTEVYGPGLPRYRDYANDIHGAGKHLLSLIDDILDISKAEAGKLDLRFETVDLAALIQECACLMRGRAVEGELRMTLDIASLPPMMIDRLRTKQVLLNLLSNAIKFTPKGGVVSVKTDRNAAGGVVICVRDTGIGIAAEMIPLVFEPFRQIDSALSRKLGGTGLGLPLVKTLMELHDGEVMMESAFGTGTSVFVVFPASRCIANSGCTMDLTDSAA